MSPSGVSWLGDVPSHWTLRRLGYFFDERREKVSDTEYSPLSVTKNGIVPQLETAAKTDDGDNRKRVVHGDFVINSRSDRKGSAGIAELDGSVSLINTVLRPQAECHSRFVHYLLRSVAFQEEFYRYGQGIVADLWTTKFSEMRAILLAMPPFPEQKAIAAFLDRETGKIDALVEEQKRLIELLKEKRQAVISHAVTKGLDPNVRMKPSDVEWLGDVPEHWDVTRLKFVAAVQTGTAKGKDLAGQATIKVPYLRVANVQDGYIDLSDVAEIEVPVGDLDRYLLRQGDVLMNEGGDFDKLGRGGIWDGSIDPCVHQNHVFSVRPHGVLPEWLNMITSSAYGRFYFMSRSKQSTNLASISSTNLMELPLALPPKDEQAVIVTWLKAQLMQFLALEEQCDRSVSLLLERRSTLISLAATGKIDVRHIAVRDEAA
ncbi:type I restriction endonuclease subunit S [Rhizobium sp. NLR8a]|nr:type I restriction endonuclease subunit S [Rhizobium sp. NLR8a]